MNVHVGNGPEWGGDGRTPTLLPVAYLVTLLSNWLGRIFLIICQRLQVWPLLWEGNVAPLKAQAQTPVRVKCS